MPASNRNLKALATAKQKINQDSTNMITPDLLFLTQQPSASIKNSKSTKNSKDKRYKTDAFDPNNKVV